MLSKVNDDRRFSMTTQNALLLKTDVAQANVRGVLVSLSLAALLSALGTSIANVGLPTMVKAFDASFQQIQWVVLAYLFAITALVVSAGRLGDLLGRRKLLQVGLGVFALASALCAVSPSLGWLIASRVLQGLGAALMMSLALALVSEHIPKEQIGSAMGILGTVSALGTALGPSLGGVLLEQGGWSMLFLVNVPLALIAWLLVSRFLQVDAGGVQVVPSHVKAVGAALLTPIPLTLFRNSTLASGVAMSFLVTTVIMSTLVVGPFYLSGALALNATQIGLSMASGPIVAAALSFPAGRLVDRLGAHPVTIGGLLIMLIGAGLLSQLPIALGVSGYIVPLTLLTAGYALFQAANNTAVLTQIDPAQRGAGSGLLGLSRNLGLIAGASLMGLVFISASGAADIATAMPSHVDAGRQTSFAVATGLITIATWVAMRR